ncbi:MAG: hypothetical protein ACREGE_00830 [Candidatus Microsaccharimonas sp.]
MNDQQNPQPELPPLTKLQKIMYSLVALIIVGGIAGLIFWNISANNADKTRDNDLKTSGLRVTGTANGEAHEFNDRSRRGSSIKYKAVYEYTYTNENRDGRQDESTAIGEKIFDTEAEVQALEGKTADVYYDPQNAGKGTYVENEPES